MAGSGRERTYKEGCVCVCCVRACVLGGDEANVCVYMREVRVCVCGVCVVCVCVFGKVQVGHYSRIYERTYFEVRQPMGSTPPTVLPS